MKEYKNKLIIGIDHGYGNIKTANHCFKTGILDQIRKMADDDINKRRTLINIFIHSIYLYDDHLTIVINASPKPLSIDDIPLEDIEAAFESESDSMEECSTLSAPVPPNVTIRTLYYPLQDRQHFRIGDTIITKSRCFTDTCFFRARIACLL